MNIVNGGEHADNNVDVQEFMVLPVGAPTFKEALRIGAEIFHQLESSIKEKVLTQQLVTKADSLQTLVPTKKHHEQSLKQSKKLATKPGVEVFLAMDVASTEFYKELVNTTLKAKAVSLNFCRNG